MCLLRDNEPLLGRNDPDRGHRSSFNGLDAFFASEDDGVSSDSAASNVRQKPRTSTAASVPLRAAERGVPYIVINRGETDHDRHPALTLRVEADVGLVFPKAVGLALEG